MEREIQEAVEVMDEYEISYNKIEKVRSAYKIIGEENCYCLKRLKHGRKKSQMGNKIVKHLKNQEFPFAAQYILTKEEALYIKKDENTYYLTEWIDGEEVDFKKKDVLIKGVQLLGKFHRASMGFLENDVKAVFHKRKEEHVKDIEKLMDYKEMINNKGKPMAWEKKYVEGMDYFIKKADLSIKLFEEYNYDGFIGKDRRTHGFCHESYYYQNVLVDKKGDFFIIDLDSCRRNIYMYDLGKFLRRMMWAKEYKWDFEVVRECIESYKEIRTVEKGELGILFGILIFPHKYIKLGEKWVENKEGWHEEKFDKKLNKQIKYIANMEKFIKDFSNAYDINLNFR